MPLFNVNIPPNAAVFFGILMSIASFDILPTDKFYARYFPQNDSGAINDNFNAVGFSSQYFLNNMGSMVIIIGSVPIFFIILLLMKLCRNGNERINRWHDKLEKFLWLKHPLTVFNESYTILVICSLINLTNVSKKYHNILAKL